MLSLLCAGMTSDVAITIKRLEGLSTCMQHVHASMQPASNGVHGTEQNTEQTSVKGGCLLPQTCSHNSVHSHMNSNSRAMLCQLCVDQMYLTTSISTTTHNHTRLACSAQA